MSACDSLQTFLLEFGGELEKLWFLQILRITRSLYRRKLALLAKIN